MLPVMLLSEKTRSKRIGYLYRCSAFVGFRDIFVRERVSGCADRRGDDVEFHHSFIHVILEFVLKKVDVVSVDGAGSWIFSGAMVRPPNIAGLVRLTSPGF